MIVWQYNNYTRSGPMFENYIDVIEASKILDVHPETVKRLIREGQAHRYQVRQQVDHGAGSAAWSSPTPTTGAAEGSGDSL